MKEVKDFLINMLSGKGAVSSKRFAAFITLLNVIIMAYISTFNSKDSVTPDYIYFSLIIIIGAGLGLTVIEKIFMLKFSGTKTTKDTYEVEETTDTEIIEETTDTEIIEEKKEI
jgi:hypothetical protein